MRGKGVSVVDDLKGSVDHPRLCGEKLETCKAA